MYERHVFVAKFLAEHNWLVRGEHNRDGEAVLMMSRPAPGMPGNRHEVEGYPGEGLLSLAERVMRSRQCG